MNTSLASAAICVAALLAGNALAQSCSAEAGPGRTALVELYTSEGCSSCPPADRWLSSLSAQGVDAKRAVSLAFHVDYWDYIGWPDRYASARYSSRQREAVALQRSRVVFTPQIMLNGQTFSGWSSGALNSSLQRINAASPQAALKLAARRIDARRWAVSAAGSAPSGAAQLYIALYENNLASDVASGENAGRRLRHDRVVREFVGPLQLGVDGRFEHRREIVLPADAKPADIGFAAFLQSSRDGDVLQAVSLPACAS